MIGAVVGLISSCTPRARQPQPPPAARVSVDAVMRAIPSNVKDRRGWAEDVIGALDAIGKTPARQPVCAVLAVIAQESGFVANPVVPNLPRIVDAKLDEWGRKAGPFGRPALNRLLQAKAPGQSESFAQRLRTVKTERDLDLVFRDLVAYYRSAYPRMAATAEVAGALFGGTDIDDLNPITTAGSMQVSVRFAARLGEERGLTRDQTRDLLYTRKGGIEMGTARLFAHDASYPRMIYRFADYNAGIFASRNAAMQEQLSAVMGIELVPDGDLLAYDRNGDALDVETKSLAALLAFRSAFASELSERDVRRDAHQEKTADFESTDTYRAIKRVYESRRGETPPYARLPAVTLSSPKLSRPRTTAWFAESVDRRWRQCLEQIPGNSSDQRPL